MGFRDALVIGFQSVRVNAVPMVVLWTVAVALVLAYHAVPSIRPPRVGWVVLAYSLWGGLWGVLADGFFTLQQAVFGAGTDFTTLAAKTAVDQLLWNVIFCTPVNAVFFAWVSRDFKPGPPLNGRTFLRESCLPMLGSNWIVFIPVTAAIYAFPLPLQIQLGGFAGAFWMLVALRAAAIAGRRP